jgi:hypothetical protein
MLRYREEELVIPKRITKTTLFGMRISKTHVLMCCPITLRFDKNTHVIVSAGGLCT